MHMQIILLAVASPKAVRNGGIMAVAIIGIET